MDKISNLTKDIYSSLKRSSSDEKHLTSSCTVTKDNNNTSAALAMLGEEDDSLTYTQEANLLFEDADHGTNALVKLNTLRKEGKLCDVQIQVGSTNFPAHRCVVACSSGLLMELFAEAEEEGDARQHFKLPTSLDCRSFEIILDYMYTSRLDVPPELVTTVYKTASVLKVCTASEACSVYLADHLTATNCLAIRAFANCHSDAKLTELTDKFVQNNITEVVNESGFTELPSIKFDIMGVTDDELRESAERNLAQLVLNWIEGALLEEQKLEHLCEDTQVLYLTSDNLLRDCLNLEDCKGGDTQDDLTQDLNSSQLVQDYKKLKKRKQIPAVRVSTGMSRSNSLTPQSQQGIYSQKWKSNSLEKLSTSVENEWSVIATHMVTDTSCLGLCMVDNILTAIYLRFRPYPSQEQGVARQLEPLKLGSPSEQASPLASPRLSIVERDASLIPLAHMGTARASVGTAVLEDKLIALGGYDRGECLRTVESFDVQSNTWKPMPPMLSLRGRFDVTQVQGKLFACGGSDGSAELSSAECYDLESEKWTKLPDMLMQRANAGIVALNGKVYVMGGWFNSKGTKHCEMYNPETNKWTRIASMNTRRAQAGTCTVNGKILVVGGCDSWTCLDSVEMYDPDKDEWSFLPSLFSHRRGAAVSLFGGKVYVVGGSDGQYSLTCVEIYDPQTQSWSHGPALSTPRVNAGVAVVTNRLFVVGGFSGKHFLDTVEYLAPDKEEWCCFLPSRAKSHSSGSESSDSEGGKTQGQGKNALGSESTDFKGGQIQGKNGGKSLELSDVNKALIGHGSEDGGHRHGDEVMSATTTTTTNNNNIIDHHLTNGDGGEAKKSVNTDCSSRSKVDEAALGTTVREMNGGLVENGGCNGVYSSNGTAVDGEGEEVKLSTEGAVADFHNKKS